MSFREPMAHVRYGKNTELAGATPGVVRPMSTREADKAYRKAWRKNNPAWYTRLWRFLAKKALSLLRRKAAHGKSAWNIPRASDR